MLLSFAQSAIAFLRGTVPGPHSQVKINEAISEWVDTKFGNNPVLLPLDLRNQVKATRRSSGGLPHTDSPCFAAPTSFQFLFPLQSVDIPNTPTGSCHVPFESWGWTKAKGAQPKALRANSDLVHSKFNLMTY